MLRVTLLGNMGSDPEVRFTAKGASVVQFRVAVNQVRTGPDGERQENTEWFRIRVAGRQADYVQRFNKGARMLVVGRLDISHFLGKDGQPRTGFDVWADEVQGMSRAMVGTGNAEPFGTETDTDAAEPALAGVSSLGGGSGSGATTNGKSAPASSRRDAASDSSVSDDLEDLPF